jgi:tRNA pseudouridine55 synthase
MVRVGRPDANLHGVIVIDKPEGPTSHDIVAHLRKTLGTRAVGHAGTLDPAASGVLVVAVGQATKLVSYLTSQAKTYEATVAFGTSTTTLDREGDVTRIGDLPVELAHELGHWTPTEKDSLLEAALSKERARQAQLPPVFSAVKQNGRSVHERARRGEHVELHPRPITAYAIDVRSVTARSVNLHLSVSKGYYVRAMARDLGETLGVPSHLSALRRVASGPFTLDEALRHDAPSQTLSAALVPLAEVAGRVLTIARLSDDGTRRARSGKVLTNEHFVAPPLGGVAAWVDPEGTLVAIGRNDEGETFCVVRGFPHCTSNAAT